MKTIRSSRKTFAIRSLWFVEMCVVMLSVIVAARLRFHADPSGFESFFDGLAARALLVAVFTTGAMLTFGLYQVYVRHSRVDLLLRIALSFALGGIALLVIYYVAPVAYIGRGVFAIALLMGMGGVLAVRYVVSRLSSAQALKQRVLVFGAGNNANLINTRLRRKSDRQSFNVLGFVPAYTTAEAFADFGSTIEPTGGQSVRALDGLAHALVPAEARQLGARHG